MSESDPKAKVPAPSAPEPKASSLFDTGWDSLLGPKAGASIFAPPAISSAGASAKPVEAAKLPSFLAPTDKPRTSESDGAVSGEFGEPTRADAADEASDEVRAGHDDDDDEQDSDGRDDDGQDSDEQDTLAGREAANEAANEAPSVASPEAEPGGSRNLLWLLGIAAAVVLAVVLVNGASSDEAGGGKSTRANKPSDPAKSDKRDDRPKPRPPVVKTHAADPKLAALREQQALAAEATSGDDDGQQPSGDQVGEDAQGEDDTPQPIEPKRNVTDPRDPSLIPPGTPAENAKAFAKLPVSVQDGPPIGGIGPNGVHIDEIVMGAGRDNNECNDPTRSFSTTGTEFVNVCVRVVHSRATDTLRVIWEQDGTVTRRGKVRIPENLHAYKTRAYLQVRPEYVGSWRVRIVPEGEEDIDLAVAQFTIE